mmetsp:Transcript_3780/g.7967  ORF Transcript_3780/g.7967 Transcript_3780/m.7967 type:complete len:308 (+) Transcript_3780:348-1271(+)
MLGMRRWPYNCRSSSSSSSGCIQIQLTRVIMPSSLLVLLLLLLQQRRHRIQQLHLLRILMMLPHTARIRAIRGIQRGKIRLTRMRTRMRTRLRARRVRSAGHVRRRGVIRPGRRGRPLDGSFELEQKSRSVREEGAENYFYVWGRALVQQPHVLQPDLPSLLALPRDDAVAVVQLPQHAVEHVLLHLGRRGALVPRHRYRSPIDGRSPSVAVSGVVRIPTFADGARPSSSSVRPGGRPLVQRGQPPVAPAAGACHGGKRRRGAQVARRQAEAAQPPQRREVVPDRRDERRGQRAVPLRGRRDLLEEA